MTKNNKQLFYFIETYGCQMNERDAEVIAGFLHEKGYTETEKLDKADLVVFNTCAVRQKAEEKIYGKLGMLKKYKNQNPHLVIVVTGCMTQQKEVSEKIKKRYPYVDLILGTFNLSRFQSLLDEALASRETVMDIWDREGPIVEGLPAYRKNKIKAWVNIIYGCNNFCSYCIVPDVRGRERSRAVADILKEIKDLAAQGFKEITLLGQNVNSYGKDLPGTPTFAHLLTLLEDVKGIKRIRYMTSHPRDFSDELIAVIQKSKKVCRHFHLPVQSGSNAVLKVMRRGYDREHYIELITKIRRAMPDSSITTDLIVGFPGEEEDNFLQTLQLVEEINFDAAYMFMYSPRQGTAAAAFPSQVSHEEKKERLQRLIKKQNLISRQVNDKLLGKRVEVLVEGKSKDNNNQLMGRTSTNKIVHFPGNIDLAGQIIELEITGTQTWSLTGMRETRVGCQLPVTSYQLPVTS